MNFFLRNLRHAIINNFYLFLAKSCVSLCIENMKKIPELSPFELVEMFVTLFCFLKDSSDVSSALLDDFRQAQGYPFLSDFLLR